jgi:thioredoxin 1
MKERPMADPNNDSMQNELSGSTGTGKTILLIAAVLVVVFGVRWYRTRGVEPAATPCANCSPAASAPGQAQSRPATSSAPAAGAKLPRLVDLGADKCIPCKALAPILEELKKEYAGRLEVQFIDVWKNPTAGKEYAIRLIPTQIFYDASGQERFRHEGFISKEDILAKWKEFGVDLSGS